jgi:uncharacterized protein (TIGR02246 family)
MKKLLFIALAIPALAATAAAQSTSAAQSADIAAIKQLNADWIHSYMTKDSATFARIFAHDFILINPAGKKFTRQDLLTGLPAQPVISSKVDTIEVRLHGNIGLVMAKCSFVTRTDGKETTGQTDYLDVYEKRNGRWWAIVAHVTYLGEPKP